VGVGWAVDLHREWFAAFTGWRHEVLELASTQGVKGFTEVFVFFRWTATNTGAWAEGRGAGGGGWVTTSCAHLYNSNPHPTPPHPHDHSPPPNPPGSYHGQTPTGVVSRDYGIMRVVVDKGGMVTDVTMWRAGFAEERETRVSSRWRWWWCVCVYARVGCVDVLLH